MIRGVSESEVPWRLVGTSYSNSHYGKIRYLEIG